MGATFDQRMAIRSILEIIINRLCPFQPSSKRFSARRLHTEIDLIGFECSKVRRTGNRNNLARMRNDVKFSSPYLLGMLIPAKRFELGEQTTAGDIVLIKIGFYLKRGTFGQGNRKGLTCRYAYL